MADNKFGNRGKSSQSKGFNRDRGFDGSKSFGRDGRKVNSERSERNNARGDRKFDDKSYSKDKKYDRNNRDNNSRNRFSRDDDKGFAHKNDRFNGRNGERKNNRDDKFNKNKRNNFKKDDLYNKEDRYENKRIPEPQIAEGIDVNELDGVARAQLRGLRKEVSEKVAKHLIMAGKLIDLEPEKALEHANFALKCASRVPIVREAVALCAYQCEEYTQALRELRAYERLTGKKTLPSIEADSLRATGKINQAVELISTLNMKALDLTEQVEVIIVSSSIRHDLGETDLAFDILDTTLSNPHVEEELQYRLLEAKANLLEKIGKVEEAKEILDSLPENEELDILDLDEYKEEVENTSGLGGSEIPLSKLYDLALFDLDGVCFRGTQVVENAAVGMKAIREDNMYVRFVTNNASKTSEEVAEKLQSFDIQADADEVITAAMDIANIMAEELAPGSKVLVVGGEGLRKPVKEAGFVLVESHTDNPDAVVQGFDPSIGWKELTEAAYSIEKGAVFYASNIDSTLPTEDGMALGNGSLVAAVQHATGKKPISGGKPFPGIFLRATQTCEEAKYPIAIGDRLGTDIAGANAANYPSLHVLTGVNDARDVAFASLENRPTYLALDITGLSKPHPYPVKDAEGNFVCHNSEKVKVTDEGFVEINGEVLTKETTITLNTYRSYVAAIWDAKDNRNIRVDSPKVNVVE